MAVEEGGWAFTVRVRPDLEAMWKREQRDPMDRIKRVARKALEAQGLRDLQYAYVVETKSRRGRSRTPLHLHGLFISNDPHDATRFKVGFEKTLATHTLGRAAAGVSLRSGPEIVLERVYDKPDGSDRGRGRWANYIAKNLNRWDARFTRRIYFSQSATAAARAFWSFIRDVPIE